MNSRGASVIIFVAGAAIGSVATWKILKTKYEKIAQEEIDSVKKVFSKRETELNGEIEEAHSHLMKNETREVDFAKRHEEVVKSHKYVNYSDISKPEKEEEKETKDDKEKPYVITPEEFGEFDDYEPISLVYYADGVLADDNDELVEEVEEVVGSDWLTRFGEYEPDTVYVRNDRFKADYEITRDFRSYKEVVGDDTYGSD